MASGSLECARLQNVFIGLQNEFATRYGQGVESPGMELFKIAKRVQYSQDGVRDDDVQYALNIITASCKLTDPVTISFESPTLSLPHIRVKLRNMMKNTTKNNVAQLHDTIIKGSRAFLNLENKFHQFKVYFHRVADHINEIGDNVYTYNQDGSVKTLTTLLKDALGQVDRLYKNYNAEDNNFDGLHMFRGILGKAIKHLGSCTSHFVFNGGLASQLCAPVAGMMRTFAEYVGRNFEDSDWTNKITQVVLAARIARMSDGREENPTRATARTTATTARTATTAMTAFRGGKSTAASKWTRTGRKACKKTVYKNSTTGELRVRKCTTARDGSRKYTYVKF